MSQTGFLNNPEEELLNYSLQLQSASFRADYSSRSEDLRGWGQTPVLSKINCSNTRHAENYQKEYTCPSISNINHKDSLKKRLRYLNDEDVKAIACQTLGSELEEQMQFIQLPSSCPRIEKPKEIFIRRKQTRISSAKKSTYRAIMPIAKSILLEPRSETLTIQIIKKLSETSKFRRKLKNNQTAEIINYPVDSNCFLDTVEQKKQNQLKFYLQTKPCCMKF